MLRLLIISTGAFCAMASGAAAAPCVSASFDTPVPGAVDVVAHVSDVPSSQFPAFWQEGRLNGYAYKIFANGSGSVQSPPSDSPWSVDLDCSSAEQSCTLTQAGTPPEGAVATAQTLGVCLQGKAPSAPEVTAVAPEDLTQDMAEGDGANLTSEGQPETDVPALQAQDNAPADDATQEPAPGPTQIACGTALTDELTEVATMQRLLTLLGAEPGPVDGFLGPQTFAAMGQFVENPGWGTSIPDLIALLDAQHCAQAQ